MATWQDQFGGGLLAGIGRQNDNAPQAGDNLATLGMIRKNNEFTRQGGNNVGLQALQGLSGLAGVYQEDQQQKALGAFNQAHAQAWKTGDNSILREFAATNPSFVAQAQQAVAGLDEQQRNEMGMLAMGANTALAQGPEAFGQYIQQNAEGLKRVGADPNWMLQSGMQNPDQLSHLATTLAMGALGPEKAFAVQDKMEGRQNDRAELAENIRSNQADEANTIRGQNISRENSIRSTYAPTSAMQNYNQYAQMLKEDPESAAAFAASAGINTGAKKLMSVKTNDDGTVTKYFADGTEEAGNINQAISTGGMRKPLTVYQADKILGGASEGSKASAGFAMRLNEGQQAMKQLIDSGQVSPARAAFISRSLGDGMIANNALSPSEQAYMINARDVVNAILRRDTGAAITQPETIEYGQMYLPQPGDSQKALETKQKKIDGRFKTFRGESGLAYEAMQVSALAYDAKDNPSQPMAEQSGRPASGSAPQQAIDALKSNPQLAEQFKAKYGYLP